MASKRGVQLDVNRRFRTERIVSVFSLLDGIGSFSRRAAILPVSLEGYNAGSRMMPRWRPRGPMETDV